MNGAFGKNTVHGNVPSPWLQVKLLQFLQSVSYTQRNDCHFPRAHFISLEPLLWEKSPLSQVHQVIDAIFSKEILLLKQVWYSI